MSVKCEKTSARFVNQKISVRHDDVFRLITSTCDHSALRLSEKGPTEKREGAPHERKFVEKDLRATTSTVAASSAASFFQRINSRLSLREIRNIPIRRDDDSTNGRNFCDTVTY